MARNNENTRHSKYVIRIVCEGEKTEPLFFTSLCDLYFKLSWISLFIAIAPSLGFLGTVIGMIQAFDAIMVAGDMSPAVVAGGMKVALITTEGGLIVAVILQIFFNYILSQVESLTINMEDASISLMDILVKYQENK